MISVCILSKNSEKTLASTLESAKSFPEIILLDTGSKDQTIRIAKEYPNVKVFETLFKGFGPLRNEAASLASFDWILALDSDEIISPSLLLELSSMTLNPKVAYSMPRHNFYNGKRIKGCGWSPDRVVRLYNKNYVQFSKASVHESLELYPQIPFRSPLFHTPYRSTSDFLLKMEHYSSLFAEQYKGKRKSSFSKALLHSSFAFFRSYFLKRGIFDGKEGFAISLYNANTAFYKYLKLFEANQRR